MYPVSSNGSLWSTLFSLHHSRANRSKMHALLNWAIAMSDQRTLFFDNLLVALHSFSFTQKIKDRSSLLSARSMYKSDVPSSDNLRICDSRTNKENGVHAHAHLWCIQKISHLETVHKMSNFLKKLALCLRRDITGFLKWKVRSSEKDPAESRLVR
jgi:hypothetical protein